MAADANMLQWRTQLLRDAPWRRQPIETEVVPETTETTAVQWGAVYFRANVPMPAGGWCPPSDPAGAWVHIPPIQTSTAAAKTDCRHDADQRAGAWDWHDADQQTRRRSTAAAETDADQRAGAWDWHDADVKAAAETETTDATEEDVTWRRKTLRVRKNGKVGTRTHKRKKLYGPVQRYADPRRQW